MKGRSRYRYPYRFTLILGVMKRLSNILLIISVPTLPGTFVLNTYLVGKVNKKLALNPSPSPSCLESQLRLVALCYLRRSTW